MPRLSLRVTFPNQSPWHLLFHTVTVLVQACSLALGQSNQALRQTIQKLLDSGQVLEAEERVKEEVSANGETPEVFFLEGMILFKRKQFSQSIEKVQHSRVQFKVRQVSLKNRKFREWQ